MTQSKTKKTNKQWHPYKDMGSYYKLEDGYLVYSAMNTDGSKDTAEADIDWEAMKNELLTDTKTVADRLHEIVKELKEKEQSFSSQKQGNQPRNGGEYMTDQQSTNKSINLTIRFDQETVEALKDAASKRGLGATTLVRMWVLEQLRQETHTS